LKVALQLAEALDYCHSGCFHGLRVLHRDLKPNNIGALLIAQRLLYCSVVPTYHSPVITTTPLRNAVHGADASICFLLTCSSLATRVSDFCGQAFSPTVALHSSILDWQNCGE